MKVLLSPRQTHTGSNAFLWRDFLPFKSHESRYVIDLFNTGEEGKKFQDLFYGYMSGYPYCCVKFFVTEWEPFLNFTRQMKPEVFSKRAAAARERWPQPYHVGYVMCPACRITRNAVEFTAFTWLANKLRLKELTDVRPHHPTRDRRVLLGTAPALPHA